MNVSVLDSFLSREPIFFNPVTGDFTTEALDPAEALRHVYTLDNLKQDTLITELFLNKISSGFQGESRYSFFNKRRQFQTILEDIDLPHLKRTISVIEHCYLKLLFEHEELNDETPMCLKDDPHYVMRMILQKGRHLLKYASLRLQANPTYVLEVIDTKREPVTASFYTEIICESLKHDRFFNFQLVKRQWDVFTFLDAKYKNDKPIIFAALKQSAQVMSYLEHTLLQETSFILECVHIDAGVMRYVNPELLSSRDFVLRLVGCNAHVLSWLEDMRYFKDEEIVRAALCQDGLALQYLVCSPFYVDKEITLLAIARDPDALEFAHDDFKKDPEIVLYAMSRKITAINHACESLKDDPLFWRRAFDQEIIQFKQIPIGRRYDSEFLALFLSHPAISPALMHHIVNYPNIDLRHFLVAKLLSCLKPIRNDDGSFSDILSDLPQKQNLSDLTPLFVLIILKSWRMEADDAAMIMAFVEAFKIPLKDCRKRQSILFFLLGLESHAPDNELKKLYLSKCFQGGLSLDETLNVARIFPAILEAFTTHEIKLLPAFSFACLEEAFGNKLIDLGLLTDSLKKGFFAKLLEFRDPAALIVFISQHALKPHLRAPLEAFIKSLSQEYFEELRHVNNSYKELLSKEQLTEWEKGAMFEYIVAQEVGELKTLVIDTENYQDLLLCGTEVSSSCLRVDGDPHFNQCLFGYLLDGKIRMIAIKETIDGPIKNRSMLKIMKNFEGKPVLFLEKSYPIMIRQYDELIQACAKMRADALGLELYVTSVHEYIGSTLMSDKKNPGVFEYEDGLFETQGITDGVYAVKAKKL